MHDRLYTQEGLSYRILVDTYVTRLTLGTALVKPMAAKRRTAELRKSILIVKFSKTSLQVGL